MTALFSEFRKIESDTETKYSTFQSSSKVEINQIQLYQTYDYIKHTKIAWNCSCWIKVQALDW